MIQCPICGRGASRLVQVQDGRPKFKDCFSWSLGRQRYLEYEEGRYDPDKALVNADCYCTPQQHIPVERLVTRRISLLSIEEIS